jgi:hypothetical protein
MNLVNSRMFVSKSKLVVWYKCLSSIRGFKRLRSSFSKSFDMLGRSDIGLYEVARSGGLPGFSSMITCAFFHCIGKLSSRKIVLKIYVKRIIVFFGNSLSMCELISSKPGAFFGLMLLSISWATSRDVKNYIFSLVSLSGWHCIISISEVMSFG